MRIAILTDLHANREAVSACLDDAATRAIDRYAFLGDLVGYGADPEWVLDTVAQYIDNGGFALLGNHDEAVLKPPPLPNEPSAMHAAAMGAVNWTRTRLNDRQLALLRTLPLQVELDDMLFVHANAWNPAGWEYIRVDADARRSLDATAHRYTFFGHTHDPQLFHLGATGRIGRFTPVPDIAIPLVGPRRWVVLPGSCGQPRDGNPAACYAVFDTTVKELTFFRVPYDHDAAADKILAAGLPPMLAQRLRDGV